MLISCKDMSTQVTEIEYKDITVRFRGTQPSTFVFREQNEWDAFVSRYSPPTMDPIPVPKVDFAKEMVIGVSWGGTCRYSGCSYGKLIERVTSSANKIEVKVVPLQIIGPCDLCLEPLHLVKVPKSGLSVVFVGNVPN